VKISINKLKENIRNAGLRVTPQRLAVLEAVNMLGNHPTVEHLLQQLHKRHPGIATGTVYKVLDTLVAHQLISRVKTDHEVTRYDGIMDHHHHVYHQGSDKITDYQDQELDILLQEYFRKHAIPGFCIREVRLQIIGESIEDERNTNDTFPK